MGRGHVFLAGLGAMLAVASAAHAGNCSNPTGVEGTITYNRDYKTMQFCNGTNWVAMGGVWSVPWQASGTTLTYSGSVETGGAASVWTANRTAGVPLVVSGYAWTTVPGLSLAFSLPRTAKIVMFFSGMTGLLGVPSYSHVGLRFNVDGSGTGDGTWGNNISMSAASTYWNTWSTTWNTTLSAGSHTVAAQVMPHNTGGNGGYVCAAQDGNLPGYTSCSLTVMAFYQ